MMRVAIVGGGISGLAAAYALEQLERDGLTVDIDLFEGGSRLGGVIRTAHPQGLAVELGPDSLVDRPRGAIELCRRLGLGPFLSPMRASAKPPLVYNAEGTKPFPRTETQSYALDTGWDRLIQTLAVSLARTRIHLNHPIHHLTRRDNAYYLDGQQGPYGGVMAAVPATGLPALLGHTGWDLEWTQQIQYQARAVVAALYPSNAFAQSALVEHTGLVVSPDAGLNCTALTWLSTKWSHFSPDGPIAARTFWGPPGPSPASWSTEELLKQHHAAMAQLTQSQVDPYWIEAARFDTALPRVPDALWEREVSLTQDSQGPYVGILGPFRNGVGVSDCVRTAWEEAYRFFTWVRAQDVLRSSRS